MANWDLETVKEMLGITGTGQDTAVQRVMDSTLGAIELLLQRGLLKVRETEEFLYAPFPVVMLPRYPLVQVHQVSLDGGDMQPMPSDWRLDLRRGWIDLAGAVNLGFSRLAVDYEGGYDPISANPGPLPPDLLRAMLEAVATAWTNSDPDTGLPVPGGGVVAGSGEVSRITLADFGSVTFDVAAQVAAGASSQAQQQADWGWLAPWAPTLQMYRSEHGVGLGIA